MISLFYILIFITLYSLSLIGGKQGRQYFVGGLILHGGYVIYRWSFLGRVPVTERHDMLMIMAFLIAASFFFFVKKVPLKALLNTLPGFVLTFCFFSIFHEKMDTIEPSMNSPWFYLHTSLLITGISILSVGAIAGIFYLFERSTANESRQYRIILIGWLVYALSLVAGSVWLFLVYGAYWLWAARELWTAISWFYYSFYLHGRLVRPLKGAPSVYIGIGGLAVLLFAYLGVTPILGSPWTQF